MTAKVVTLQAWRLENKNGEHYKQYTALAGDGYCLFFNSRIGSTWVNQSPKGPVLDWSGKAMSQVRSKERGGYEQVWQGDVVIPVQWAERPQDFVRELQNIVESAYLDGAKHADATTGVLGAAEGTPLSDLLDDCRDLVSKMADTSDATTLLSDFAAIQGARDKAFADLEITDGYLDTLRMMIGAK